MSGSNDGKKWEQSGIVSGDTIARRFADRMVAKNFSSKFANVQLSDQTCSTLHFRFYRLEINVPNAKSWAIGEFGLFNKGKHAAIGGPYSFTSAWMSAGSQEEWVYVDLGAKCTFDRIVLSWIRRAAAGSIQASDDAAKWRDVSALPENADKGLTDDIKLDAPTKGRYVRVLMKKPASAEGYILSEMEVFGTGGPVPSRILRLRMEKMAEWNWPAGAWRIQRESSVNADGETLSKPGFNDSDWIIATVPGTALVSYLNAGALPDPNFGDNQLSISDSYFYSDFWYRNEFIAPASSAGQRMFLNFDGINWKAEVYLNGRESRIDCRGFYPRTF